jgi:hypothetical protein
MVLKAFLVVALGLLGAACGERTSRPTTMADMARRLKE